MPPVTLKKTPDPNVIVPPPVMPSLAVPGSSHTFDTWLQSGGADSVPPPTQPGTPIIPAPPQYAQAIKPGSAMPGPDAGPAPDITGSTLLPPVPSASIAGPPNMPQRGIQNQSEYFASHPDQQAQPILQWHPWKSLFAGLAAAGMGWGGNPSGAHWLEGLQQHDLSVPDINTQRYQAGYLKPQLENQTLENSKAQGRLTGAQADIEEQIAHGGNGAMLDPRIRSWNDEGSNFVKSVAQKWQAADLDPQSFDQWVKVQTASSPYARFLTPEQLQGIKQLPRSSPNFKIAGGTIEPVIYQGKSYGLTPEAGEPPEVAASRQAALGSLQKSELAKLDPIIRGQLGDPPTDPTRLQQYMQKAQAIKTQMATAGTRISLEGMMNRSMNAAVDNTTGKTTFVTPEMILSNPGRYAPAQYDPNTQATLTAAKSLAGEAVKNVPAIKTAIKHLDALDQAASALEGGNVKKLNEIANVYRVQVGNTPLATYEAIQQIAKGDILAASSAVGAKNEQEEAAVEAVTSPAKPSPALHASIAAVRGLMTTRIETKGEAFKDASTPGGQNTFAAPKFGGPPTPNGAPKGATHKAKGSDGQWHYTNDQGRDLGVAQ